LKCNKIKDLIVSYIYDELSLKQKEKLDLHISSCSECSRMVDDYKGILDNSGFTESIEPSSYLDTRILTRARQNTSFNNKLAFRRKPLKPLYPTWALTAILIGVILVIFNIYPRIDTVFTPQIAKIVQKGKDKALKKSKVGIVHMVDENASSSVTDLTIEKEESIPVLVESNKNDTVIKPSRSLDDAYNKHPFAPYGKDSTVQRLPQNVDFASFQYEKGVKLKSEGNCQDANDIFVRIIREYPRYARIKMVYIDSADCFSKLGKNHDALNILESYLKQFPKEENEIRKIIADIERK